MAKDDSLIRIISQITSKTYGGDLFFHIAREGIILLLLSSPKKKYS